jgi:hypothetical protein
MGCRFEFANTISIVIMESIHGSGMTTGLHSIMCHIDGHTEVQRTFRELCGLVDICDCVCVCSSY